MMSYLNIYLNRMSDDAYNLARKKSTLGKMHITYSELDDMSLASFCQSRAVLWFIALVDLN